MASSGSSSSGEAGSVVRGYLPTDYYTAQRVFKPKPPALAPCSYPNKIDIDSSRSYAILVQASSARLRLLQSIYAWMSVHFYIAINVHSRHDLMTGNVVVEAYDAPKERAYAMVIFRAATDADEQTDRVMRSHGHSGRRGPCPPPRTALLCQSGVTLQSVWQWLNLHRGRLAYMVGAPQLRHTVAVAVAAHRERSRDSLESALPAYEPPQDAPIPEDDPPAYSAENAQQPACLLTTQSLPELLPQSYEDQDVSDEQQLRLQPDESASPSSTSSGSSSRRRISNRGRLASAVERHLRRTRLAATTAPDYCPAAARRRSQWLWRLLRR